MMKILINCSVIFLFSLISIYGQSGTITFSGATGNVFGADNIATDGEGNSADIPGIIIQIYGINSDGTIQPTGTMGFHNASDGYSLPLVSWDDGTSPGYFGLTIKSSDGSNFRLTSVNFEDWGSWSGASFAVEAFNNGASLGSRTFAGNTSATYIALDHSSILTSIFDNVDEVRIHLADNTTSWVGINDIVISPAIVTPTTQASSIGLASNAAGTQLTLSWSNGNGSSRAVFMKQGTGSITNPSNLTPYTASSNWSSKGTQLSSSGYYCVYNGTGSSVVVTNTAPNTQYTVQAFEYNGSTGSQLYNTTTASGNPSNQTTLPVELVSFTASTSAGNVVLNWKTATEISNYGFDIERRSVNLNGQFEKAGFIKGSGNSNSEKNYTFTDKGLSSSGRYEYRLKQIDTDGKFKYSNIISLDIKIAPKDFALLQNYPNPFNPSTKIRFALPLESNVKVEVYNSLGQIVKELVNGKQDAGFHEVNFNASYLTSGIYFYSIIAISADGKQNFKSTQKMLLVK
ncbi:MAG: T9SS type A sorting domain-containing protein [Bacteroidota bacterium]|nr:T9SS type A sorting domain-containing protein [Bacteroidota bacterium]